MPLTPIPPRERSPVLDALRGAALFGVLLENIQHFVSPPYFALIEAGQASGTDRLAFWLMLLLLDHKIYLLFSLLFGYGIALQMRRAQAVGSRFAALHLWRMASLFLIGLAHLLLWSGDILSTYAALGCLLLPVRSWSDRALLRLAALSLALPTLGLLAATLVATGLPPAARGGLEAAVARLDYPVRQALFAFAGLALGLAAGRRDLLTRTWRGAGPGASRAPDLDRTRALGWAVGLGLLGGAAYAWLALRGDAVLGGPALLREIAAALSTPALAAAYAAGFYRLATRPGRKRWRIPLAAVGRATLSNYVLQSALGVGLLAHLGPIHPPLGFALACVLFGLQVAVSSAWLARYRYGPLEWLWRSLSYGRLEPMARERR